MKHLSTVKVGVRIDPGESLETTGIRVGMTEFAMTYIRGHGISVTHIPTGCRVGPFFQGLGAPIKMIESIATLVEQRPGSINDLEGPPVWLVDDPQEKIDQIAEIFLKGKQ